MGSVIIRGEKPEEIPLGAAILQAAYGRDLEARRMMAIRDYSEFFHPGLSIVAADGADIVGYALYCKTAAGSQTGALLAAIGVLPDKQRQGVGERLVRHGLERCRGLRLELVFAIGDPGYFTRVGFLSAANYGIQPEFALAGGQSLLVIDLAGGLLAKTKGVLRLPPPLAAD